MNSVSLEKKGMVVNTRSKTYKKDTKSNDDKITISKGKTAPKIKGMNRKGRGTIYIGHIPHGFYEDEMKSYFNQFGKVVAAVVARSKKTGRSKGYGFVEFKDEEVAKIAAETMNNYLMFNRILKCRYIPPEEKRDRIIEQKIMSYDFPRQRNRRISEKQKIQAFSKLTPSSYLEKAQTKIDKFKKFFEEQGIDFSFQLQSNNGDEENNANIASSIDPNFYTKDDTDDELDVLEMDENESEIDFKAPVRVRKVLKKSLSFVVPKKEVMNTKHQNPKNVKTRLPQKSRSNKTQSKGESKQKGSLGAVGNSQKLIKKTKNSGKTERCLKAKEFLEKDISVVAKQKKAKSTVKSGKNKTKISVKT